MNTAPNLLVTDDDGALRTVLCDALSHSGCQVHQASDGQEALQVMAATPIHFALVDIHMPRLNGLDVIRELEQVSHRPLCALMSAGLTEQIIEEAQQMDVYRILSKPIRLKHVRELVFSALTETYGWKPV